MRRLVLPTLSGVLYFLSWIGFGIWPLAFVCFVPLLWALRDATPRRALWVGAWMGFVTHLGGYTWIMHVLQVFANAPLPLAFAGYLVLCAVQGLLFGVMSYVLVWVGRRTRWPAAALLPIALVATEFGYPLLFQSYTGIALMPVLPLVQIAELGGVLILSALQAVVNGALFDALEAWRSGKPAPVGAMAASLVALLGSATYGYVRLVRVERVERAAPKAPIGLAQPNVGELELHEHPLASVRTLQDETAELHEWSPLSSPLARGQSTAPLRWRSWRFATFICYEDILPGIVRSIMADHAEGRAHAMVNLTNDSWYGAGHEQEQHLMLAAARSIEHRRWLLRATSTGISAFVDATGRVVQRIGRNQRGVALAEVPMLQGTTPYEVLGDWPGWVSLVIIAGAAVRGAARARSQRPERRS